MFNNKATAKQNWNNQKLIKLSQILGEAYLPGSDNDKSNKNDWSMSRFIEMNKSRSNKSEAEENLRQF